MSTVQYLLPRSLPGASISVPLLGTAQQTSSVQVVYECESAMVSGLWRPLKGYLLEGTAGSSRICVFKGSIGAGSSLLLRGRIGIAAVRKAE